MILAQSQSQIVIFMAHAFFFIRRIGIPSLSSSLPVITRVWASPLSLKWLLSDYIFPPHMQAANSVDQGGASNRQRQFLVIKRDSQQIVKSYKEFMGGDLPSNRIDQVHHHTLRNQRIGRIHKGFGYQKNTSQIRLLSLSSHGSVASYQVKLGVFIVYVRLLLLSQDIKLNARRIFSVQAEAQGNSQKVKTRRLIAETITANGLKDEQLSSLVYQFAISRLASAFGVTGQIHTDTPYDLVVFKNSNISFMEDLQRLSTLQKPKLATIQRDVKQRLRTLHALHICHRDIKPQNILWSSRMGRFVFCDFGVSTYVKENLGEYSKVKPLRNITKNQKKNQSMEQIPVFVDYYSKDIEALSSTIKNLLPQLQALQKNPSTIKKDNQQHLEVDPIELEINSKQQNVQSFRPVQDQRQQPTDRIKSCAKDGTLEFIKELEASEGIESESDLLRMLESLTFHGVFEVSPFFTEDSIALRRRVLGKHTVLDDLCSALRDKTIATNTVLLKRYHQLVQLKIFGMSEESTEKLAQLRSSKCQFVYEENFEVIHHLLVSPYYLSRAFRQYYIEDLHRCATSQKMSLVDKEFTLLLTKILSREVRFRDIYDDLSRSNNMERVLLLAIVYGTIGPNHLDEEQMEEYDQGLCPLLCLAMIGLNRNFPWCAAESLHLMRLVLKKQGPHQNQVTYNKFFEYCFQQLTMEEQDEDPLCKLARLNIKIFRTLQKNPTKEDFDDLKKDLYLFNVRYCQVFPPLETFERYGIVQMLLSASKKNPKEERGMDSIRRQYRPYIMNPLMSTNVIYNFYRLLSEAQLFFYRGDWSLGDRQILEARRLYKQNRNKLVFLDWAQMELTNAHSLIQKRLFRDVQDLLEKIQANLPNQQNSQKTESLTNSLLEIKIQLDILFGRFAKALENFDKLSLTKDKYGKDYMGMLLEFAKLRIKCGDYQGGKVILTSLREELMADNEGYQKKRMLVFTNIYLAQLYLGTHQYFRAREHANEALKLLKLHNLNKPTLHSSTYFVLATIASLEKKPLQEVEMCWNVLIYEPAFDTSLSIIAISAIDGISNSAVKVQTIINSDIFDKDSRRVSDILQNQHEKALQLLTEQLSRKNQPLSQRHHFKSYMLKHKLLTVMENKNSASFDPDISYIRLSLDIFLHFVLAVGNDLPRQAQQLSYRLQKLKEVETKTHQHEKQQIVEFLEQLIRRSVHKNIQY